MHKNMVEYNQHKKAKSRVGNLFVKTHKVEYEKEMGKQTTEQGERNYIADIYLVSTPKILAQVGSTILYHPEQKIIIEIDGERGHSSKRDLEKMKLRDATFRAQGIKTVRLATAWCVGRHAVSDADLMAEINWQLSK